MEMWFSEFHTPDVKHSIRVNRQLYSKQSDYQRIDIFHLPNILIIPYLPFFPLKPKTSPFPAGFTRQRERGCFLQIQTQSAITLYQAGSPATAGWPSTQWITFLGHLVTQVPQEEHLA